ncbi:hypothetical protein CNR33_00081 [Pseudomonas phage tabernarius]|uniref:Uncharacterized protein n=1 Tax=Pseudomonas phage tabernarius TaxID=2048978 RepID=A0A2H4P6X9_9CAUD|nr:hypothetical protein FDJ17_gp81 [Pseudomonas phage tabernarius]ATW57927.1 hypothetical protein CNR33_00081 [Pseudomonas phage tabernarius]
MDLDNLTVEELKKALINSALVIAAQATELVGLKEANRVAAEENKVVENLEREVIRLNGQVLNLKRNHIATTKNAKRKALAYLDENGKIIVVGEDVFKSVAWVSGNDRAIPYAWSPIGIIPKLTKEDL